jgi:hypothetical protein
VSEPRDIRTNVVNFRVDGVAYDVDLYDIDGTEWRDVKRATGMMRDELIVQAVTFKEFDCVAALLWIWRRRAEPELKYDEVLRALSLRAGLPAEGDEPEADAAPPA